MRIVSLVPEASEILAALGIGGSIVPLAAGDDGGPAALGVGEDVAALARALRAARPDLVFASETGAGGGPPRRLVRRAVAALRPRPAVFALEPASLGEILADVKTVGDAIGRQADARALTVALRARVDAVTLRAAQTAASGRVRRVACLASVVPLVAAGGWLAELVGLAGGLDVLDGIGRPPRPISWAEIRAAGPELVVWAGADDWQVVAEGTLSLPGAPGAAEQPASASLVEPPIGARASSPPGRGGQDGRAPREALHNAPSGGSLAAGPGVVAALERLAVLLDGVP